MHVGVKRAHLNGLVEEGKHVYVRLPGDGRDEGGGVREVDEMAVRHETSGESVGRRLRRKTDGGRVQKGKIGVDDFLQ